MGQYAGDGDVEGNRVHEPRLCAAETILFVDALPVIGDVVSHDNLRVTERDELLHLLRLAEKSG